jgi:hypothetical protein
MVSNVRQHTQYNSVVPGEGQVVSLGRQWRESCGCTSVATHSVLGHGRRP